LGFVPSRASVAVAGVREPATTRGREIAWPATHAGGMTINVRSPKGWVIYVGRLKLR
jgi:hypothetical protein